MIGRKKDRTRAAKAPRSAYTRKVLAACWGRAGRYPWARLSGRSYGNSSAFHCPARCCLAFARQFRCSHASDCGFCSLCTCFCCYEAERLNSNDKGAFHSARQRGMLLCNCGVLHSYLLKYKPVMAAKHNFSLNLPRYPFF